MGLVFRQEITNAGGTFTFDPQGWGGGNAIIYLYASTPITLASNVSVAFSSSQNVGSLIQVVQYFGTGNMDLNGNTFQINGESFDQWVLNIPFIFVINNEGGGYTTQHTLLDLNYGELDGDKIIDASLTLAKFPAQTRGSLILGNASARPALLALGTANYVLKSDGTDAAWSLISNSSIDAAAAIARTKIANGTADYVLINSGTGGLSQEQRLATTRGGTGLDSSGASGIARVNGGTWSFLSAVTAALGGTGIDTSGSTGYPTIAAGTWSVGAKTESIVVPVSWESGEQCNNRVQFQFPCTITNIYAVVTKALANTDAGTIVPKDGSGTNMTLASALSFPLSSALETAIDTAVTADNVVAAGDEIYLTTAKATAGGKALVTITFTRTTRS